MAALSPLSYSSSRTYLECPLRWKFLYVDRLPETPRGYFSFGRTIHAVLEELVRPFVVPSARRGVEGDAQRTLDDWRASLPSPAARERWSVDALLELYQREWVADGYTSTDEEARYKALGAEMLLGFYEEFLREPPRPVAVEAHLSASWDGIPIHGYVDRIDRTSSGGLEILDYKTTRDLTVDDARESDQLALYQVLVEHNFLDPVEGLTLYHLRSLTPMRSAPRPRPALEALYDRLGTVSDGIRSEAFEPSPGRHCSRCEFQSRCPEFRTVPVSEDARLRALVDRFGHLREEEGRVSRELERTAEELHRAAETLGVHRLKGSRATAIRHKEEIWRYPPEKVAPLLERAGIPERDDPRSPAELRRIIRDPSLDAETRRRIAEAGTRRVKWYWELERSTDDGGGPA